ncbi:MAG: CoA transferase, partial [Alphaproteobacteria bacterium]|nr:CoA transferase [Alphaproteobacteria bacterium]
MSASAYPLDGVTVLDLGQIYAGPYACFLMAMAGAEVIKIEPPHGEPLRRREGISGGSVPLAMLNANKRGITLNLKHERARELLRRMVGKADVLLENFAPTVMDRLGVGPEALMALNSRLIYASGSGYGRSGPRRDDLAMDLTVQAVGGVMSVTGFPDGPPVKAGPAICDFIAGTHLYGAVVTALFERERTGKGRLVEVAMLDAIFPTMVSNLGMFYGQGDAIPHRTGNRHGGLSVAPYNVYAAKDG